MANSCIKLEVSSVNRSRNVRGCKNLKCVMWSWPRPLGGTVSHEEANTSPGQLMYKIRSLYLQPLQRYFRGSKIIKCVTWPWPRPFQGWLVDSRLGLATINLQTKFEVSNYTHYEDMRNSAKCTNWGSLEHLRITQGHRQCHSSIEHIRLPIRL